jgi:nitroreductase
MAINEVIKKRKSIRQYVEGAEVTDEQIRELLEAAQLAPSACNQRPWGFIVVQNKEVLAKIQAIHPFAQMLRTASAAIILTIDTDVKNSVSDGFSH